MLLLTTWFGSFLLDEGTVVDKRLFPMDANALADRLALVEDWKVLDEERDLMARADEVFVIEPRLERAGGNRTTVRPPFLKPEDFGYGRELLHGAMVQLAKRRMRKAIGPEDHLRQAVGALDELQEERTFLSNDSGNGTGFTSRSWHRWWTPRRTSSSYRSTGDGIGCPSTLGRASERIWRSGRKPN